MLILKKSLIRAATWSEMYLATDSFTLKGGAMMRWSPLIPSADPVPGYVKMRYGSVSPAR